MIDGVVSLHIINMAAMLYFIRHCVTYPFVSAPILLAGNAQIMRVHGIVQVRLCCAMVKCPTIKLYTAVYRMSLPHEWNGVSVVYIYPIRVVTYISGCFKSVCPWSNLTCNKCPYNAALIHGHTFLTISYD